MAGPGLDLIGEDEIAEIVDVLRSGYLARYGPDDDPGSARVRSLEDSGGPVDRCPPRRGDELRHQCAVLDPRLPGHRAG